MADSEDTAPKAAAPAPEQPAPPKIKKCPACNGEFPGHLVVCPNDRTMLLTPKKDELIGQILNDRYKVVEEVGRGGMSAVYRGVHELMDRTVAIKVLLPQLVSDQISIKRFQQEAQAASHLQHPNVITVYDYGFVASGQPYLVMDFLEGESLSDIIRRDKQVTVKRMIPIFIQACEALEHAHQKGVIHRDLKSSNIMLIDFEGKKDFVKVVDFGIAKLMPSSGKQSQNLTQTGEVFGSPIYMSPEQCMAQSLDARSDIYSMGAMMYESLTGHPPLMGNSIIDTMQMHMSTPPKPFKDVRPDLRIPDALERVVLKALAKKPEGRYQSMQELRDALEGVSKLMEQEKLFGPAPGGKAGSRAVRPVTKPAAAAPGTGAPAVKGPQAAADPPAPAAPAAKAAPAAREPAKAPARPKPRSKAPAEKKEAREGPPILEQIKSLEFFKQNLTVTIAVAAVLLAGLGAGVVFLFSSSKIGSMFSMQSKAQGIVYYYKPANTKKKVEGEMYIMTVNPEEDEAPGELLKLNMGTYNIEDRAANADGAGIGDFWQIVYHKSGDKNFIEQATVVEQQASEDLRQVIMAIRMMFTQLCQPGESVNIDNLKNFYTNDWFLNDAEKLAKTWGKVRFETLADANNYKKSSFKIESYSKEESKASVLVKTKFWVKEGPGYMRFELIKKDGKKWLILKIEEISPNIWLSDGVAQGADEEEEAE
ncbi:MAG: serine/threonine protein kinase [Candidatus Obscuribacterales bacterium]